MILTSRPAAPIGELAIAIGLEGAVSVIRAVYLEKLDLDGACVGGNSPTPLAVVSVLENLALVDQLPGHQQMPQLLT